MTDKEKFILINEGEYQDSPIRVPMNVLEVFHRQQKLIRALETLKEYCDKKCDMCRLKFVCSHYFDYGTMGGYAESALRVLKK